MEGRTRRKFEVGGDLLDCQEERRGEELSLLPRPETDGEVELRRIFRRVSREAGLRLSEVPAIFYQAEDVELGVWGALVNDRFLSRLAASNLERMENGVFPGSQLCSKELEHREGAMALLKRLHTVTRLSEKLPFAGIRSLVIPDAENVTDAGLLRIAAACTSLARLNVSKCNRISDVSIRAITKRNRSLQEVDLSQCSGIVGAALVSVAENCKKLQILRLQNCIATDEWILKRIAFGLPNLIEIDVSKNTKVTDDSMRTIACHCKNLKSVHLGFCTHISDVSILALSEFCPALEHLDLSRSALPHKVTDVSMLSLGERCPSLKIVHLAGNSFITDVGINWLVSGCNVIERLNLSGLNRISDMGMRSIGEYAPELKWLDISGLKVVSDTGIRHLGDGCRNLEHLNCSEAFLLTDALRHGLPPSLNSLILNGCFRISRKLFKFLCFGVDPLSEKLSKEYGYQLTHLSLNRIPEVSSKSLAQLLSGRSSSTISTLSLAYCSNVNDHLVGIIGRYCQSLQRLNLSKCENISNRGLGAFCMPGIAVNNLKELVLSGCCKVGDIGLLALAEAGPRKLEILDLEGCINVTETAITWLANKVPSLLKLNLLDCDGVSANGLRAIVSNFAHTSIRQDSNFFGIFPRRRCRELRFIDKYGEGWNAAILVQTAFRKKLAKREVEKRQVERLRNWTARRLQALWRTRKARQFVLMKRMQRNREIDAAVLVQSLFRRRHARKVVVEKRQEAIKQQNNKASTIVQCFWRMTKARRTLKSKKQERCAQRAAWNFAATEIQRIWRGFMIRCNYDSLRRSFLERLAKRGEAALDIERVYRGHRGRMRMRLQKFELARHEELEIEAAKDLQRIVRGRLARKKLQAKKGKKLLEIQAAVRVQSRWRARNGQIASYIIKRHREQLKLETAALRVQGAWRRRQGFLVVILLRRRRLEALEKERLSALKLQGMFRRMKARKFLNVLRAQKLDILKRQEDLDRWAATLVQKVYRGRVGRRRAAILREEKKKRWKEMYDVAQDRPFYYNQDTGEVRWRMPQDMLDLLSRPFCSNCAEIHAYIECGTCIEYFCEKCWENVHSGGLRKDHHFRALYDAYGKRVDYGDGEWPSIWPTEIEQDDRLGWHRLVRQKQAETGATITAGIPDLDPVASISMQQQRWRRLWDLDHNVEIFVEQSGSENLTLERPPDYNTPRIEQNASIDEVNHVEESDGQEWLRVFAEDNGQAFYHNLRTGISVFERPSDYISPRDEALSTNTSGWSKFFDDSTGLPYFYNKFADISQFERPQTYFTPRDDLWHKFYDETADRDCYYNEATGITQFMRPEEFETPREEADVVDAEEEEAREEWNPTRSFGSWHEFFDESSGLFYFFNTETEETTFDVPPELACLEVEENHATTVEEQQPNEDWSDEGAKIFLEKFKNQFAILETETPPLQPERRKAVEKICEEFGLACIEEGFGSKLRLKIKIF